MKICMVAPIPPPYGGIGNWVLLTSKYAKERGDVEFVHVNTAPKNQELEDRSLFKRIAIKGVAMLYQRRLLKKTIAKEGIDVIHMTTSGQLAIIRDLFLLRVAKRKGIPTVYHVHFGRIPQIAQKNTAEWKLLRRAMRSAARVIVLDQKSLEAIKVYAPEVSVSLVPNPLDIDAIEKYTTPQLPDASKEVVFLGWVVRTKGIEILLSAWERIFVSHPDWRLRIIGPCNESYLRHLQESYAFENVVLEGEQSHDRAMSVLSTAGIFVLPSETEGFPYAVLEAMGLGRPIIATDVGAIPEMLEGECGIVIPSQSVEDLVCAIERLLNDTDFSATLAERAYLRVKEKYSLEKVFAIYEKIWREAFEPV